MDDFDRAGDLTSLSPAELLELTRLVADAHDDCEQIFEEHARRFPSIAWFAVSITSGLGGLVLLEPTIVSIVVTTGGILGAAKSLYDRGAHLIAEQKYLEIYWRVATRKDALKVELTRRGIR